jgi:hypothetical protein
MKDNPESQSSQSNEIEMKQNPHSQPPILEPIPNIQAPTASQSDKKQQTASQSNPNSQPPTIPNVQPPTIPNVQPPTTTTKKASSKSPGNVNRYPASREPRGAAPVATVLSTANINLSKEHTQLSDCEESPMTSSKNRVFNDSPVMTESANASKKKDALSDDEIEKSVSTPKSLSPVVDASNAHVSIVQNHSVSAPPSVTASVASTEWTSTILNERIQRYSNITAKTIVNGDGSLGEVREGATIFERIADGWVEYKFQGVSDEKAQSFGVYLWKVQPSDENESTVRPSNNFFGAKIEGMFIYIYIYMYIYYHIVNKLLNKVCCGITMYTKMFTLYIC